MRNQSVFFSAIFILCLAFAYPSSLVSAALSLESSFNVSQSYTDNLFYEDKNTKSDFGTFIGPNLTLQYDNPDIVIGGTYFGRVALFINNPDANTYIQNANIILDLPFLTKRYKKLSVTLDENMTFTPQLDAFSFSGAQDATTNFSGGGSGQTGSVGGTGGTGLSQGFSGTQGVFTRRADAFFNRAGVRLGYAWAPHVTPSLTYANQYRHFFSSGFQDSITHIGRFSLAYGVSDKTTVTPSYSYRQTDFLGESTQSTFADKIIVHNPQLQISYNFTPLITGTVRGGAAFIKQKNAGETDDSTMTDLSNKWQTSFVGGATIAKLYRGGNIFLNASQNIGAGGGLASQATRTRIITLGIRHEVSQKLGAFGSIGWAKNTSTDGDAFDTNTYRIQGGIGYAFLSWLSATLSYSHIDQRSNGSVANDLKADQVFIGLIAVADPWVLMR
ncbi:MAG: hypothetical protein NPIRA03_09770 [Nitrospirales bacterium]|nr:MAG: hypothetical protein NPIRA03_09770 [Nitrospirales bacterium]